MIARDPEAEAGYDYLITILIIMPMLMLWSSTVMDHNLRKNNGFGLEPSLCIVNAVIDKLHQNS